MKLSPLGDQAILARFDDEAMAAHWAVSLSAAAPSWLVDVVPAYASVGVFFDPAQIRIRQAEPWLQEFIPLPSLRATTESDAEVLAIPCCYEMGTDLAFVAEHLRLTTAEVINLHTSVEYRVYAIGFCPGFPYLGYLPNRLSGVPRLGTPRLRVEAGSVGLTGRQTGIYALPSPGGWPLIGRTPLTLVDLVTEFFAFSVGIRVRFSPIDASEFDVRLGDRLRRNGGRPGSGPRW